MCKQNTTSNSIILLYFFFKINNLLKCHNYSLPAAAAASVAGVSTSSTALFSRCDDGPSVGQFRLRKNDVNPLASPPVSLVLPRPRKASPNAGPV